MNLYQYKLGTLQVELGVKLVIDSIGNANRGIYGYRQTTNEQWI